MPIQQMLLGGGTAPVVEGQTTFTTPGSHQWTVPAGVSSVSVVCIGGGSGGTTNPLNEGGAGGALAYGNNISVTAGSVITVVCGDKGIVSTNSATNGGTSSFNGTSVLSASGGTTGGVGGTSSGSARTGGGDGGDCGLGESGWGFFYGGGGGGTGGYGGDGGDGGDSSSNGSAGSSDAGGGGSASNVASYRGGAGGGSGLFGTQGTDSNSSNARTTGGTHGSLGSSGQGRTGGCGQGNAYHNSVDYLPVVNSTYFGAGCGSFSGSAQTGYRMGAQGAVRIIWPGDTRTFPSNCADV